MVGNILKWRYEIHVIPVAQSAFVIIIYIFKKKYIDKHEYIIILIVYLDVRAIREPDDVQLTARRHGAFVSFL